MDSGPPGVYLRGATLAGSDVLADGIKVSGPGAIEAAVVLASDGGTVGGTVHDKDGQPIAGATVV